MNVMLFGCAGAVVDVVVTVPVTVPVNPASEVAFTVSDHVPATGGLIVTE